MQETTISPKVQAMLKDYQSGKTLAEIGSIHGVSRQRVHQIFKQHGVTSVGKGIQARVQAKKDKAVDLYAKRIMSKWGMTVAEYDAHVAVYGSSTHMESPMHKYLQQRDHSKRREIAWLFTFKTWWDIWEQSGKWSERGRSQYVMGREGDASTPMSPTTCRISTLSEIICGDFFVRRKPASQPQELMAA